MSRTVIGNEGDGGEIEGGLECQSEDYELHCRHLGNQWRVVRDNPARFALEEGPQEVVGWLSQLGI